MKRIFLVIFLFFGIAYSNSDNQDNIDIIKDVLIEDVDIKMS